MGNMGYCRFENTYSDLQECYGAMDDDLSELEEKYRQAIIRLCDKIAEHYGDGAYSRAAEESSYNEEHKQAADAMFRLIQCIEIEGFNKMLFTIYGSCGRLGEIRTMIDEFVAVKQAERVQQEQAKKEGVQ